MGKIVYQKYCKTGFRLQHGGATWTPTIAIYWGSSVHLCKIMLCCFQGYFHTQQNSVANKIDLFVSLTSQISLCRICKMLKTSEITEVVNH